MVTLLELISNNVVWIYLACGLAILLCLRAILLAIRDQREALFTLEKEAATNRAYRALTITLIIATAAGLVFFVDTVVQPVVRADHDRRATPTMLLNLTPTFTPAPATPTRPPTATPTRLSPTATIVLTPTVLPPTPTSAPPPPPICPDELARITRPREGDRLRGVVEIQGSANTEGFQFYKIEYGIGQAPTNWNVIGDLHYTPVEDGPLLTWDTTALANGPYILQLTVVDETGNFPDPCQVSVVLANEGD